MVPGATARDDGCWGAAGLRTPVANREASVGDAKGDANEDGATGTPGCGCGGARGVAAVPAGPTLPMALPALGPNIVGEAGMR